MAETRARLFVRLLESVGAERFQSPVAGDGWPARVDVRSDTGLTQCAMFVGPIGLSHRGRDEVERRFQNPLRPGQKRGEPAGKPIVIPTGTLPLLLGVWQHGERTVVVAADPVRRMGNTTRYSIFAPLGLLTQAAEQGWADRVNSDGERLVGFWPELLPVFVDAARAGVTLGADELDSVLEAAGLREAASLDSVHRTRRAAFHLVRRKAFSAEVCRAYDEKCALCGFNFSLVVGAHIYPASAPGAPDAVWNGVALCNNHHAAFDAHLIHVAPDTRTVGLHPSLLALSSTNAACKSFVDVTFGTLREPRRPHLRPTSEMLARRYDFFPKKYDWAL
jgi:hypothetical protein